jgi:hypothetical protein
MRANPFGFLGLSGNRNGNRIRAPWRSNCCNKLRGRAGLALGWFTKDLPCTLEGHYERGRLNIGEHRLDQ